MEETAFSLSLPAAPGIEALGIQMSPALHPICGPGSGFGRSLLHKAVCEMDISGVQSRLSSGSGDYLEQRDKKGYCPIHSACALCLIDPINSAMAGEIVRLLIAAGADASIRDLDGNTSLHWAARAGDKGTAELLLLKNSPKGECSKILWIVLGLSARSYTLLLIQMREMNAAKLHFTGLCVQGVVECQS